MHEVLVNRLGGLSLPRKSVVRLTDRIESESELFTGDTSKDNHSPGPSRHDLKCLPWTYNNNATTTNQWVKRWPTDLPDEFDPRSRKNLLNRKRSSIAHSFSLSTSHRPDMTETLLKRT